MRKFGRKTDQRRALLKGLVANLVMRERIKTTQARAKEMRSLAERLITYAKKNNLTGRRQVAAVLPAQAAKKLFKEIAPRFAERRGGYTRIIRLGQRMTDGAEVAYIEFLKD